jgi:hypothetical protein
MTKDETLEAIIAGAKANGSWDKTYPDDKKAQPAQGWKLREVYFDEHGEPIMHREPAQEPRPSWIELTDEEIQKSYEEAYKVAQGRRLEVAFARVVLAKSKEKNT